MNASLFELKELKDFSGCLLKLITLRAKQRKENSSKTSIRQINEIFREINEKKVNYEKLKEILKGIYDLVGFLVEKHGVNFEAFLFSFQVIE